MTETRDRPFILVAYPPVSAIVDTDDFARRFPEYDLAHTHYELAHEVRSQRALDPQGSLGGEPVLSAAQAAEFALAEILVTLDAPRDLRTHAPLLRWVQAIGSGTDQFGVSRLGDGDITLTNAAGIAAAPIAEWVIGRIFAIYKLFDRHAEQQRRNVWEPAYGSLIAGKVVAVIGLGAIGQEVAWRCSALGMIVLGVRRTPCAPGDEPRGVSEVHPTSALASIIGRADIVVSAVPAGGDTDDLFDADIFAAMRPSSVFINVGRGNAVDEQALQAALRSGHLRAAAIDVAKLEPLPPESPLWSTPNLAISPHSSTSQDGYMERVWRRFLDNLEAYRAGRSLSNVVRPVPEEGA